MPFYEYKTNCNSDCENCRDVFEVLQRMSDEPLKVCPVCGKPVDKQISQMGAIIIGGRQANQYSDVKYAKYWRDKNGVRHKVTPGDGDYKSSTVSKEQKYTPEQVEKMKKKERAESKRKLSQKWRKLISRGKRK